MESAKHGNSDTSSDENDQQVKVNDHNNDNEDDDSFGTGRSYQCTFCRRGFTNAQALGGHMNIHRKDKAKAKAKQQQQLTDHNSSLPTRSDTKYYTPVSAEKPHHYAAFGGQIMNYDQLYFSGSNPSSVPPPYYVNHDHLSVQRSEAFSLHEESQLGKNLSLQIAPRLQDTRDKKENEVLDLELRLGYLP